MTPKFAFLCALINILGYCNFGFEQVSLNIIQPLVQNFINQSYADSFHEYPSESLIAFFYGFASSLIDAGAIIGTLIAGQIADRIGRKKSMVYVMNLITIIGCVVMALSSFTLKFELLLLGRFIVGITSGLSSHLVPLYLIEFSRTEERGHSNSWHSITTHSWGIFALIISMPKMLGNERLWWLISLFPAFPAIIFLILGFWLPETPAYLFVEQRREAESLQIIARFHGKDAVEPLEAHYRHESQISRDHMGLKKSFQTTAIRKALWISIVSNFAASTSGQSIVQHYSGSLLSSAGFSAYDTRWFSLFPFVAVVVCGLLCPLFIERAGRRPLLLTGFTGMILTAIVFMIIETCNEDLRPVNGMVYIALVCTCLISALYSIGPGPIPLFVGPEMTPTTAHATVNMVGNLSAWGIAFIGNMIYPVVFETIGILCFIPLVIIPTGICTLYLALRMPETKYTQANQIKDINHDIDETSPLKNAWRKDSQDATINSYGANL